MAAGLEQQHRAAPLGQLAGNDAAARARADDDTSKRSLTRATRTLIPTTPRYDQSFLIRIASGEWKSISSYALGPLAPGATKSL